MPTVSVDIRDTYISIVRPVALEIISDIKRISGIEASSKINLLGATGKALQPTTTIDLPSSDETSTSDMMLQIEVTEEFPEGSTLTTVVERRDSPPCFLDPALGVRIKPAYNRSEFTLNIKARFPDRVSAVKFRNEFKRHTTQGRRTNTHKVTYSYAIPEELLIILGAIHRLREKQAGYGDDLTTWIGNNLSYAATTLTNRAGANPLLTISQTQNNIIGRFDILVTPEPAEVDRERGTWEISFIYKFSMDVPAIAVMEYPLIVHNQMLNSRWRPSETPDSIEKSLNDLTLTQYAYEDLRKTYPGQKRGLPGISYPAFDDWYSGIIQPAYAEMIRIAITLDPTDLKLILNLNDLGDFVLDPLLISFLTERPGNVVLNKQSVIKANLYAGTNPVEDGTLEVLDDLTIRSKVDLDLRTVYHLTLTILVDLTALPSNVIDDLRTHGLLVITILKLLYPNLEKEGLLPILLSDGSIRRSDFITLANIAKDYYLDSFSNGGGSFLTVGLFSIIGMRR